MQFIDRTPECGQVRARAEPSTGTGDDDGTSTWILIEVAEQPRIVRTHVGGQCVQTIGPIQRYQGNGTLELEQNRRVWRSRLR